MIFTYFKYTLVLKPDVFDKAKRLNVVMKLKCNKIEYDTLDWKGWRWGEKKIKVDGTTHN